MWQPIDSLMPLNKLVLVYSRFHGYQLRQKDNNGNWFDDNEFLDDSETEFEYWHELPERPE